MRIGQKYQDSMDRSRTIIPIDREGNSEVFFDGRKAGRVKMATTLFCDNPEFPSRYGFNLIQTSETE